MKFGIFYEHQLPRPWTDDSEYQLMQDALEQIEFADKLGIDHVWEVEHHFLEEYSHSSAPEVFLAAASQRTKNIRLGHGIVQTPPPFNHPARVAERIATLDLVSNGRVDFGTGESSSEAELGGFMIDPEQKREMWEEGLRVAVRCLTEAPFTGHSGEFVTMPPRNVVPKPRQKPHPPLWVACSRRDTIHLAAQKGIGALAFAFVDPEEASTGSTTTTRRWRARRADRRRGEREHRVRHDVHVPRRRRRRAANAASRARTSSATRSRTTTCSAATTPRGRRVGRVPAAPGRAGLRPRSGARGARRTRTGSARRSSQEGVGGLRGAVGTPDQVRDYLRRYEECGVDQVIFCLQAGKNRHEHIMESLELFGPRSAARSSRNATRSSRATRSSGSRR